MPDTHALLWYLQDHPRCTAQARQTFAAAGTGDLVIPVIVLAELLCIARKQQWERDFSAVCSRLQDDSRVVVVPFTAELLHALLEYPAFEMHDAVIIATAQAHHCAVMTRDRAITASGLVPVLPV